jgi:hypothetical protein
MKRSTISTEVAGTISFSAPAHSKGATASASAATITQGAMSTRSGPIAARTQRSMATGAKPISARNRSIVSSLS